ncbi:MAG: hypothetical protein AB8B93_14375 [Pseudomonadales bacterium]
MNHYQRLSLLIATLALAASAQAAEIDLGACNFTDAPAIADGTKATQEQMTASATAVRGYMGTMQDALACLDEAEKKAGADITAEQKAAITSAYNSGVDKLNGIAEEYNAQVRAFKNR